MSVAKLHWMFNPGLAINEKVFGQRIPENVMSCTACKRELIICKMCHRTTEYEAFGKYEYKCKYCTEPLPCLKNIGSGAIEYGVDKIMRIYNSF
jgi:hypothetical protein